MDNGDLGTELCIFSAVARIKGTFLPYTSEIIRARGAMQFASQVILTLRPRLNFITHPYIP
jgi:hypothetical protein